MPSLSSGAPLGSPRSGASPASIEAIYAVGHWLLGHERLADAAKVFRIMLCAAPSDERAWLGLGECHQGIGQLHVAAELFGAGSVAASRGNAKSVRCLLARARIVSKLGGDTETLLDDAERSALLLGDDELAALVGVERGAGEP